jgi:hypothetical protein
VLAKYMFTGTRSKEFENWMHSNIGENYVFGFCQQGVAGLRRLKASASLPSVKLPPAEALQAIPVSDKFSARAGSAEDGDSDSDYDDL